MMKAAKQPVLVSTSTSPSSGARSSPPESATTTTPAIAAPMAATRRGPRRSPRIAAAGTGPVSLRGKVDAQHDKQCAAEMVDTERLAQAERGGRHSADR